MKPTEYKRLRESIGTQAQVAHLLDVNIATVDRRENGRQEIRREADFAIRWLAQEEKRRPSQKVARIKGTPNGRPAPSTRKRRDDRKAEAFAQYYHSEERVLMVKDLPCVVPGCPCRDIENAHTRGGGTSRKGPYYSIVPACRKHHREMHRGQQTFERKYRLDLAAEARAVEARWRMHEL